MTDTPAPGTLLGAIWVTAEVRVVGVGDILAALRHLAESRQAQLDPGRFDEMTDVDVVHPSEILAVLNGDLTARGAL
jgi:hypothetical protein